MKEEVRVSLLPHYERLADSSQIPEALRRLMPLMLEHQLLTYQKLRDHDLVANTSPTGTGKTKASLLHLLDRPGAKVLFIAPTNELIRQHAHDIQRFVEAANLPHLVLELNARLLRGFDPENELRRQGERLHRLLENPLQFADKLNIPEEKRDIRFPVVLVTNPDIFYYALYFGYNRKDERNVFFDLFRSFDYVVIDEFHYYNPKQLSNFLFYFALSLSFGHFQHGRKICLLSATPSEQLREYITRLTANGLKYAEIPPGIVDQNDPLAVRTLAPVELTFTAGDNEVTEYVGTRACVIHQWIKDGLDGAIISNALTDINRTVQNLRARGFTKEDYRRITGPYKDRSIKPLVVATPTVDIGYNFEGRSKQRQNLDFVIFTSAFSDEFWQRIGRAGRVLGKAEQDIPSQAISIVPLNVLAAVREKLAEVSGPVTRHELKERLTEALPTRQPLFDYLRSFAINESFFPLYKLGEMMGADRRPLLERTFELVRALFAPHSKRTFGGLCAFARRYTQFQDLIAEHSNGTPHQNFLKLVESLGQNRYAQVLREFRDALQQSSKEQTTDDKEDAPEPMSDGTVAEWINTLRSKEKLQRLFDRYVLEEFYAIRGLFNFRDSFGGLTVVAYDPHRIYIDEGESVGYDLFHILRHCKAEFYRGAKEFSARTGCETPVTGDFYCQLRGLREKAESLRLEFALDLTQDSDDFEKRYCNRPIAVDGLRLIAKQIDGFAEVLHPLPPHVVNAIIERFIPCLIVKRNGREFGVICRIARDQHIPWMKLTVTFADSRTEEFAMIVGTSAYLVGAKADKYFNAIHRKTQFYIC